MNICSVFFDNFVNSLLVILEKGEKSGKKCYFGYKSGKNNVYLGYEFPRK
jgi:hypothetical protein